MREQAKHGALAEASWLQREAVPETRSSTLWQPVGLYLVWLARRPCHCMLAVLFWSLPSPKSFSCAS